MTGQLEQDQRSCPTCGHAAVTAARWCGHCGERLADAGRSVDSPSFGRIPRGRGEGTDLPGVAAVTEAAATEPAATEPAGVRGRWRTPVGAALAAVLVLVAAGLVVTRPTPPALDELGAIGAGFADGRDAARTGRTGQPALADAPSEQWSRQADLLTGGMEGWAQLTEHVVLLHRANQDVTVLDRTTGEPLWSTREAAWLGVYGDLLVRQGDGAVQALDVRTGEVRWEIVGPVNQGGVFGGAGDHILVNLGRATPDAAPRVRWISASTGQTVFENTVEGLRDSDLQTVWVEDADERWIMLSHGWSNEGGHQGYSFLSTRDGSVSPIRPDPLPDGRGGDDAGEPVVSVLLDGDRALVGAGGQLDEVDLVTGEVLADRSALITDESGEPNAHWVDAGGGLLAVHGPEDDVRVLDRSTLEPRWTLDNGWLDLWRLRQDPSSSRVVGSVNGRSAVIEVTTGRVVFTPDMDRQQWMDMDATGLTSMDGTTVTYHSHDGQVSWRFSDRGSNAQLGLAGDAIYLDSERGLAVHDVHGGWVLATRPEASPPYLAGDGEHLVEVTGAVVKGLQPGETRVRWTQRAPDVVLGLAVGASGVFVTTAEVLQRFDVETGELQSQRGVLGVRHLSVAGDGAEAVLVALTGSGCGDRACEVVAQRHDAITLDEVWASDPIAGACAGATLAGHHVAVPTATGMTFLDARTGVVTHTWEVAGASCLDGAWSDGEYVLVTGTALMAGRPADEPRRIELDDAPTGAPILLGRQAVFRTAEGIRGIDLDTPGETWFVRLEVEPVAGPVAHDGGLLVALADRTVLRLG